MKPNYIIAILLLIALSNNLTAQKEFVGFDTGFGTYEMTHTKHILESAMKTNVLQPQPVSNFPGYLFLRPYFGIEYQYFNVGIAYTLMSTGSRYSIHDYSGEYKFDTQIVGNAFGLFAEIPIYSINRIKLLIAAESGIILNTMKLDESIQITGISHQQNDDNLTSTNVFIKPYLKAAYEIRKDIGVNFLIGYHKDIIANRMHLQSDILSVTDFSADWDGIRTSIGISYRFD